MSRPVSETDIEQAEQAYRDLEETYRRLGSRFAEAVRRGGSLEEFQSLRADISYLLRKADLRRTELRHEYLTQRLQGLENEHQRAHQNAKRTAESLKKARRADAKAQDVWRRVDREVRQLEGLREREEERLEKLRKEEPQQQDPDGTSPA